MAFVFLLCILLSGIVRLYADFSIDEIRRGINQNLSRDEKMDRDIHAAGDPRPTRLRMNGRRMRGKMCGGGLAERGEKPDKDQVLCSASSIPLAFLLIFAIIESRSYDRILSV